MARGTGLPGIGDGRQQIVRPAEIVRAETGTASLWGQLAETGAQVARAGAQIEDARLRAQKQQVARILADSELAARRTQTDIREKFRYDPEGFNAAWQEYTAGILGSTDPSIVPEMRVLLGQEGLRGYNELSRDKANRDEGLAKQSNLARLDMAQEDLLAVAANGGTADEIMAARGDLERVLGSAVALGFMASDEAQRRLATANSRATAEAITVNARSVYEAQGADAAIALVRSSLVEAVPEGVTVADARAAAARATAEINRLESARRADLREARAAVRELRMDLKDDAREMMQGFGAGAAYTPERVETLAQRLESAGAADEAQELRRRAASAAVVQDFAMLPPVVQGQMLTEARAAMDRGEAEPWLVREMEETQGRTRTALEQDPMGLAARVGLARLPAVDWTAPADQFAATMAERNRVAGLVEQHYGLPAVAPLTRDEVAGMKNEFDRADAAGRVQLLGRLADTLPGDRYTATLKDVAGERPVFGWAGGLMRTNRDVAVSVIRGEALMAADRKTVPSDSAEVRAVVDGYLREAMANAPQARAAAVQAAMARYADLSAQAGDLSGALDDDRMEQALADVTGGVTRWHGRNVVLPPGMDEDRFEAVMDAVADADLAGAVTPNGRAVTAADFRRERGTLVEAGAGRYRVMIGDTPVMAQGGGYFTLDVPAVMRAQELRRAQEAAMPVTQDAASPSPQAASERMQRMREQALADNPAIAENEAARVEAEARAAALRAERDAAVRAADQQEEEAQRQRAEEIARFEADMAERARRRREGRGE